MKLQYLGTAAAEGFPAMFCDCETCERARKAGGKNWRLRSGMLVNDTAMIDFAPDTLTMVQRFGVRLSAVRDLFVTHSHHDHFNTADLSTRENGAFCVLKDARPMNVFANEAAKNRLDAYVGRAGCAHYLNVTTVSYFQTYEAENGMRFTFLPADHAPFEKAGFYVMQEGDKTAVYMHDTGIPPQESMAYLQTLSIDFLSVDCTYGLGNEEHGHMGVPAIRRVVEKLRQSGALKADATVVLHHFTHFCGMLHEELEQAVKEDGFLVAYDGMIVEI